jgi:hypothetical protein
VSLLQPRLVWPALLCVIGTGPIFFFITLLDAMYSYDPDWTGLLLVLWLLTISLILFLDGNHHLVLGVVAVISFGLPSILSILLIDQFLSGQPGPNLQWYIVLPVLSAPLLGLIGALWALVWKPFPQHVTPDALVS